jgi:hypothetical protein
MLDFRHFETLLRFNQSLEEPRSLENLKPQNFPLPDNSSLEEFGIVISDLRVIPIHIYSSTVHLIVPLNESIWTIQRLIQSLYRIPTDHQRLFVEGFPQSQLDPETTLDLCVRPNLRLTAFTSLFIRKFGEPPFGITFELNAKVGDIKTKISETQTLGISSPQLFFQGRELQDEETINQS